MEILSLKPRRVPAIIIFFQIFEPLDLTGQEASSQWTVRHKTDSQLPAGRKYFILHIPAPKRVLRLQYSNRMDGKGSTKGAGGSFGHADVADFTFADEIPHSSDRFFNRSVRIDSMLIVQINMINA